VTTEPEQDYIDDQQAMMPEGWPPPTSDVKPFVHPVTTETGGQPQFPRDIWIDVETGAWGLVSNLHLVEQSALPIGDAIHDAAYMRCAGIDHGVPVAALLRSIDHV